MAKFVWQDGTLVSKAKVEVGGTIYEVDPEEYSGSTPLSASNLNAMVDNIYDDMKDVYSTTETQIGTWLGKPLYRKVITGTLSNTVNHGISNAMFHRAYGGYYNSAGTIYFPLANVRPNASTYEVGFYVDETKINFDKGSSVSATQTFEIVLEYTKTTT